MSLLKRFSKSLYSPKYIAAFRFESIGKTITYVFFLSFIMGLPAFWTSFIYVSADASWAAEEMKKLFPFTAVHQDQPINKVIFLLTALFSYYVFLSFTLFLKIMLFALIAFILVLFLKKRGEYRHLFRITAYSLTLPLCLTVSADIIGLTFLSTYWIDWLLVLLIILFSIRYLPPAKVNGIVV
ncbi:DUF1189 family protein [Domibacillus robiginosus]|uniref:DUF1189 family protein n=1 Tax=Domibacillus robiginosus TaxID=1071054 RepID=UPI00067AEA7E|nr:DUF1189 family protein [Domibacillus robiginosus]